MQVWSNQKTVCIDQDIAFCGGIITMKMSQIDRMEGLHASRDSFSRSQFPGRNYVNPTLGSDYLVSIRVCSKATKRTLNTMGK